MNRRVWIHLLAAAALLAPASRAADEALPKAEEVLDRYVEVTGGKAAYQKRENEVVVVDMEFVGRGIKGTLTRYANSANNAYASGEIEGIGKIEEGVYNGQAWENSPIMGPRLKTGEEGAMAVRDATFNATTEWRKLYKAEVTGTEKIADDETYKVVLTPIGEGKPQTAFYSKKTGLLTRMLRTAVTQMGEMTVEQNLTDYQPVGEILSPRKIVQEVAGMQIAITVQSVKTNEDIPKDRFEPPAEVKKLMAK